MCVYMLAAKEKSIISMIPRIPKGVRSENLQTTSPVGFVDNRFDASVPAFGRHHIGFSKPEVTREGRR